MNCNANANFSVPNKPSYKEILLCYNNVTKLCMNTQLTKSLSNVAKKLEISTLEFWELLSMKLDLNMKWLTQLLQTVTMKAQTGTRR